MEAYVNADGKMKPEFLKETTWNVFIKLLLTQIDCLCLVLSWCIAIYLCVLRATFFFIVDVFPVDQHPKPPTVDRGSSPDNGSKPDDDDQPRDGKPSADGKPPKLSQLLLKRDSGLSSFDSGSSTSGSPKHQDSDVKEGATKSVSPVGTETNKDLKHHDSDVKEGAAKSVSPVGTVINKDLKHHDSDVKEGAAKSVSPAGTETDKDLKSEVKVTTKPPNVRPFNLSERLCNSVLYYGKKSEEQ